MENTQKILINFSKSPFVTLYSIYHYIISKHGTSLYVRIGDRSLSATPLLLTVCRVLFALTYHDPHLTIAFGIKTWCNNRRRLWIAAFTRFRLTVQIGKSDDDYKVAKHLSA